MLLWAASMLALGSFIILAIFIIVFLSNAGKFIEQAKLSLNKASADLSDIKKDVKTTLKGIDVMQDEFVKSLHHFNDMKAKAVDTMTNLDDSIEAIQETTQSVRTRADAVYNIIRPFNDLSEHIYNKIAPPLIETANFITAATKAFSTFSGILFRKKQKPEE